MAKRSNLILLFLLLPLVVWAGRSALAAPAPVPGTLYQLSTIDALLAGVYDGQTTLAQLAGRGDLGLGTYNALDGEMIVLEGVFYRVSSDGVVHRMPPSAKTPFANLTFFHPDQVIQLRGEIDYPRLQALVDKALPSPNLFYALRIRARFQRVKARSVPRQHRPYPPLVEVVKHQGVFPLANIRGTMLGFRCPAYVKGINVTGYHLHFLSDDRQQGGHVLGFAVKDPVVEVSYLHRLVLELPRQGRFAHSALDRDRGRELDKVEK